jgi:tetratricopeptide (TPR) repeat protein
MADWFRNTDWDEAIAAEFERRLARSRQPAQHLVLQGYTLLTRHPDLAERLLERAILLGDPQQTARAALYRGTALAILGRFDAAIEALELAMATEVRFPEVRTGAWLDHALLVSFARREADYGAALERLSEERALPFEEQSPTALIADTLMRGAQGQDVAQAAQAALELLGHGAPMPTAGLSHAALSERLMVLADLE